MPLENEVMQHLTRKSFSDETRKKINWVLNMYRDWHVYRNNLGLAHISCDLDNMDTVFEESLKFALCRFIVEVKKIDGSDFPAKTLYDIIICVQFHLELQGVMWRLLNDDIFSDVKFTLDNIMKERTSEGVGISVRRAEVLLFSDEDVLWSLGFLGTHNPQVLLNTVVYMLGISCALHDGKEHRQLRSPPNKSQFHFFYDDQGKLCFHYVEDVGLKTNKGGLKHRKIEAKSVDVYTGY